MTGKKSHPLEIFRASGTFQRPDPLRKEPGMAGMNKPDMPVRVPTPSQEFELRLSLTGGVVLLFAWVVLIGAAYLYGYKNGESSARDAAQQQALAKGDALEQGDPAARPTAENQPSALPFGVSLIAYDMTQVELLDEMTGILETKYDIARAAITEWPDNKKKQWMVYIGEFADADDPALKQLLNKLRAIDDYPRGQDKRPFSNARIARHPGDPAKFR
jgi:hypothetical protein